MKQERTTYTHLEAERALVSTLYSNPLARQAVFTESGVLTAKQFSVTILGQAFASLEQMYFDDEPISLHALHAHIERGGYKIGEKDNTLLNEVCGVLDATSDYLACVEVIQARHAARQSQRILQELGEKSANAFRLTEVSDTIDTAQQRIEALQDALQESGKIRVGAQPLSNYLNNAVDRLQTLSERDDSPVTGMPTGLTDLDNLTTGLQPADLCVIGARPSMGKTALLIKLADAACAYAQGEHRGAVVIYSMEMLGVSLINRYLSMKGHINLQALRTGKLDDDEWVQLSRAIGQIVKHDNLFLCDEPSITSAYIQADLRRKRKQFGRIAFVGIDYLGLMESAPGARNDTRANEVAGFSRDLKRIALQEECPVVALAQLNRSLENRPNKRPLMSDLRDSGGIEQDADLIAFLYRDEYYNPDTPNKGVLEIIIAKQRNGPTGVLYASFDGRYTSIENLSGYSFN